MNSNSIDVWDPLVRVFHWTLVISFFTAYVTEDEVMWLHEYAGYMVLGLVLFRVVWGFIGTRYARFSDFVYPPGEVIRYIRELFSLRAKHYLGHNPAGGMMVVVLLVMLLATSWTGILAYEQDGQFASSAQLQLIQSAQANGRDDDGHESEYEGDEFWEEIHEFFANFTLLLVFLHISGVVLSSFLHNENLVRAMITGKKIRE